MKTKPLKTRDWNMVRIIQGVTKAAVHVDKKKAASRKACRSAVRAEAADR
jgi:hypothetical protein